MECRGASLYSTRHPNSIGIPSADGHLQHPTITLIIENMYKRITGDIKPKLVTEIVDSDSKSHFV